MRPIQLEALGGYIPFVDLPCERDLGESLKWVAVLFALPFQCKLIPWLCCPVPVEEIQSELSISTDIDCSDPRAPFGGMIHWSMVGVSIAGLVLSILHLGECGLVQAGVLERQIPSTIVLEFEEKPPNALDTWINNLEATLQNFQKNYLQHDSNYNSTNTLTIKVPSSFTFGLVGKSDGDVPLPNDGGKLQDVKIEVADSSLLNSNFVLQAIKNQAKLNAIIGGSNTTNNDVDTSRLSRTKRGARRVKRETLLSVPLPEIKPFYQGPEDGVKDICERNQVLMTDKDKPKKPSKKKTNSKTDREEIEEEDDDDDDDDCYDVLSQGPCGPTEVVIADHVTGRGICAPRLCAPDMVFLLKDQMCHDPNDDDLCSDDRKLTSTLYGSPACSCPDGFYEMADASGEEECRQLLTANQGCPVGEVLWFRSFKTPVTCLPDPCGGLNLHRSAEELPYVPTRHGGKDCYQIAEQPAFCAPDEYYSMDLPLLRGVCRTLEDAGYLTLSNDTADAFKDRYGTNEAEPRQSSPLRPFFLGQSAVGAPSRPAPRWVLQSSHPSAHAADFIALPGNDTDMEAYKSSGLALFPTGPESNRLRRSAPLRRSRRSPLPHAAPATVFTPALASCRAGAARDINAKCRDTVLPSERPNTRPRRAVRPRRPVPSCPKGSVRNLRRRCTRSTASVRSSIIALGLG